MEDITQRWGPMIRSKETGKDTTANLKAREILIEKLSDFVRYEWRGLGYDAGMNKNESNAVEEIMKDEYAKIKAYLSYRPRVAEVVAEIQPRA